MFTKKQTPTDPSGLDEVISSVETDLQSLTADDPKYKTVLANYQTLLALKLNNQPKSISPDTIVSSVVSIAGILIIVGYEHAHPITSKAIGFVKKLT